MVVLEYLMGIILRILLIPLLIFSVVTGAFIMMLYGIFGYILGINVSEEQENEMFHYIMLWPLVLYSNIPGVKIYRKK